MIKYDYTDAYIAIPMEDSIIFEAILAMYKVDIEPPSVLIREYGEFGSIECKHYYCYTIYFDDYLNKWSEDADHIKAIEAFIEEHPLTDLNDGRTLFYVHGHEVVGKSIGEYYHVYMHSIAVDIL